MTAGPGPQPASGRGGPEPAGDPGPRTPVVAIIGGGIAGLAAAYALRDAGPAQRVRGGQARDAAADDGDDRGPRPRAAGRLGGAAAGSGLGSWTGRHDDPPAGTGAGGQAAFWPVALSSSRMAASQSAPATPAS